MERNLRKTRVGKVVSNKMDKTIVVAVEDHVKHPLYKKIYTVTLSHLCCLLLSVCFLAVSCRFPSLYYFTKRAM